MAKKLNILILDPFHTGSHAHWSRSLEQRWGELPNRRITLCTLPGRHWKWRMHSASAEFAQRCRPMTETPDAIICTDMMDVASFKGLLRRDWQHLPVIQYFHENQITFPWSPTDPDVQKGRDRTYGMMNILSAMAADAIWFNSDFHRKHFISAIATFMGPMPDGTRAFTDHPFEAKSQTLPIGIEWKREIDCLRPCNTPPTIVWNHRWEFDKAPAYFYRVLNHLQAHAVPFSLILLGPKFETEPDVLLRLTTQFRRNIIHEGFAPDRSTYAELLHRSDFVIHSPKQEYFGISVLEAMSFGVIPLLGKGNAYDDWCDEQFLVDDFETIRMRFEAIAQHPEPSRQRAREISSQFQWDTVVRSYDNALVKLIKA